MTVADNFLKASRRFGLGDVKKQMAINLVSATEVSDPNTPNVNVSSLAPRPPSTGGRVQVAATGAARSGSSARSVSFRSAGVPENISISKGGKKGFAKFGRNPNPSLGLASALSRVSDTNPFGINPADTTASLFAFKEGGFINKK